MSDKPNEFRHYHQRNEIVRRMGFRNYAAYLESDLWKKKRQLVLVRDGHQCRICKKPATTAHHTRYSAHEMKGTGIKRIIAVCSGCHRRLEFNGTQKNGLSEANRKWSHALFMKVVYARQMEEDGRLLCSDGEWPYLKPMAGH
jgi:5-methylcytosine-specific restriction endonuclease McrA